eukprot:COSAG01_NODE_3784_length_5697_cov_2.188817_2_plen_142_part_00
MGARGFWCALAQAGSPAAQSELATRWVDRWESAGWQLRCATDQLWAGVRDEHALLGTADCNLQHVIQAIVCTFDGAAGGVGGGGGGGGGAGGGGGGGAVLSPSIERLMQSTKCTVEQARTYLDATSGDVEQAAAMLTDNGV